MVNCYTILEFNKCLFFLLRRLANICLARLTDWTPAENVARQQIPTRDLPDDEEYARLVVAKDRKNFNESLRKYRRLVEWGFGVPKIPPPEPAPGWPESLQWSPWNQFAEEEKFALQKAYGGRNKK